jgi:hypothetical protein
MRLLFALLLPLSGFALYNGNPSLPMMPERGVWISKDAWVGLKVGALVDWVYDCPLEGHGHNYQSLGEWGVLTLNFSDRVELYTTLGTLSCSWHQSQEGSSISYQTGSDFAWGIGGRALLAYWGELQLSLNAAYEQASSPLSHLNVDGQSYSIAGASIDFNPWQIGAGVSYRCGWLVPYIGVDYLNLTLEAEELRSIAFLIPRERSFFTAPQPWGLFFGFGIAPPVGVNLNLEARILSEYACSASADFKF